MRVKHLARLGLPVLFLAAACGSTSPSTEGGGSGGGNGSQGSGGAHGSGGSTGSGSGGSNHGSGGGQQPGTGGTGTGGSNGDGTGGSSNGSGGSTNGSGGSMNGSGGRSGGGGTMGSGGRIGGSGGGSPTGSGGTPATGTGGGMAGPKLITSSSSMYWNTAATATTTTSGTATVTVNDGTAMQTFEGFGGAFNEAGWNFIKMLSASDQTRVINLLFDANDGAHFVMGRIPIGASDYALTRYSEDETANDTSLAQFSISRDMMYLIPYVKAAQGVNSNLRLWASPWTPPTWMKTASGTVQSTSCAKVGSTAFDGECMQDIAANLTAYAQYFVKWVQAYSQQGITIEFVAPQNEPNYAQGYPSALWTPALYTKFLGQYLAPALTSANLSTKIMLGTMSNGDNGQQSKDLMVVTAVMADSTAKNLVKVLGVQWGMLDIYESNASWLGIGSLPVWATEHKCGNYPWNPSGYPAYVEPAPNDQAYGIETWGYISKAIRAGVTAYNAWNMVLDPNGKGNDTTRQWSQDALLIVNSSKTLTLTPAYYVFRHVSQYAQPQSKVVATSGGDAVAFKNPDGSIAVAMYNSGAASTYIVQVKGTKYSFSMPGNGWATLVVP